MSSRNISLLIHYLWPGTTESMVSDVSINHKSRFVNIMNQERFTLQDVPEIMMYDYNDNNGKDYKLVPKRMFFISQGGPRNDEPGIVKVPEMAVVCDVENIPSIQPDYSSNRKLLETLLESHDIKQDKCSIGYMLNFQIYSEIPNMINNIREI